MSSRRRPTGAVGFLVVLAALTATVAGIAAQGSDSPLPTRGLRVVDPVDLRRYAGRWYEVARLPNRLQDQCAGDVVAHYAVRPDGRIDVVNRCRTAAGTEDEVRGIGRKAGNGKINARLEIRFGPAFFSFLPVAWDDYWIIGLGPDYTWAVVGVPNRRHLWILSRMPEMSPSSYQRALEVAKGNGFDVSGLIRTPQTPR
jgi:apolipoprotein D and lipocalin family protein